MSLPPPLRIRRDGREVSGRARDRRRPRAGRAPRPGQRNGKKAAKRRFPNVFPRAWRIVVMCPRGEGECRGHAAHSVIFPSDREEEKEDLKWRKVL